jgi:hypothetical protein
LERIIPLTRGRAGNILAVYGTWGIEIIHIHTYCQEPDPKDLEKSSNPVDDD